MRYQDLMEMYSNMTAIDNKTKKYVDESLEINPHTDDYGDL